MTDGLRLGLGHSWWSKWSVPCPLWLVPLVPRLELIGREFILRQVQILDHWHGGSPPQSHHPTATRITHSPLRGTNGFLLWYPYFMSQFSVVHVYCLHSAQRTSLCHGTDSTARSTVPGAPPRYPHREPPEATTEPPQRNPNHPAQPAPESAPNLWEFTNTICNI